MSSARVFIVLFNPLFVSSCVTSFETGQEAATLPKKDLAEGIDFGAMKMAVSLRYGLLNKFDLGAACDFNFLDTSPNRGFPEFSTDCKWQFWGVPEKHFVPATGVGFGTGVERTWFPYIVYRFGFYDQSDSWEPGDDYMGYRSLNQVFGGTAFSFGLGDSRNSLLGVMNLLSSGPGSPNTFDEVEIYLCFSHKFHLGKKK